jgi:hypothetical protein
MTMKTNGIALVVGVGGIGHAAAHGSKRQGWSERGPARRLIERLSSISARLTDSEAAAADNQFCPLSDERGQHRPDSYPLPGAKTEASNPFLDRHLSTERAAGSRNCPKTDSRPAPPFFGGSSTPGGLAHASAASGRSLPIGRRADAPRAHRILPGTSTLLPEGGPHRSDASAADATESRCRGLLIDRRHPANARAARLFQDCDAADALDIV